VDPGCKHPEVGGYHSVGRRGASVEAERDLVWLLRLIPAERVGSVTLLWAFLTAPPEMGVACSRELAALQVGKKLPGRAQPAGTETAVLYTPHPAGVVRADGERIVARNVLQNHVGRDDDARFVVDLGTVHRMMEQWVKLLPRVQPFYAVKCNEDPMILRALESMGTGFDCASASEFERVLAMGVPPDRIIYANPTKQPSHLKLAKAAGVLRMTFDNYDELVKVATVFPEAELVLRVLVDDSYSVCKLGIKYGAPPSHTRGLLRQAHDLGLSVVGVSFHVGSGCQSARAFSDAVIVARRVFDEGIEEGFDMTLLDIGGGFPGTDNRAQAPVQFDEIATVLTKALDTHFPEPCGVRIIAEPGRYFVCASHTEACCIISRRVMHHTDEEAASPDGGQAGSGDLVSYYINDGVYGSFNCTLYDHVEVFPQVLSSNTDTSDEAQVGRCTVWGPTCDSMDKVASCSLPRLDVGDWLFFEDMGAYTCCASSNFNGFANPKSQYIFSAAPDFDLASLPAGFPAVSADELN